MQRACDNIDIAEYIKNNNNEYEIDNKRTGTNIKKPVLQFIKPQVYLS